MAEGGAAHILIHQLLVFSSLAHFPFMTQFAYALGRQHFEFYHITTYFYLDNYHQ